MAWVCRADTADHEGAERVMNMGCETLGILGLVDRHLNGAQIKGVVAGNIGGIGQGLGLQLVAAHHTIDETQLARLTGVDEAALEQQLLGHARMNVIGNREVLED